MDRSYLFTGTTKDMIYVNNHIYMASIANVGDFYKVKGETSFIQTVSGEFFRRNFVLIDDQKPLIVEKWSQDGSTIIESNGTKRVFSTGASRNSDEGKIDYDGFLSPSVLLSYGEYMNKNRTMEDGTIRESDNWQKGIPIVQYRKSMWRHFVDVWTAGRNEKSTQSERVANLNALLFNVMGMLHEELKGS